MMHLLSPSSMGNLGPHKYYFRLRRDKKEIIIRTNRFYSNGHFESFGKFSMFIPEDSGVLEEISKIREF